MLKQELLLMPVLAFQKPPDDQESIEMEVNSLKVVEV